MQIVSSYGVEVKKQNIPIRHTLDIFRKAVSYLVEVYAESWEELSEIGNAQKRFNEAEHLVHETKKNRARFAFDRHFPKMPSARVLGTACSHARQHGATRHGWPGKTIGRRPSRRNRSPCRGRA